LPYFTNIITGLLFGGQVSCVWLYERGQRLGGQLIPAAIPPGEDVLEPFTEYLVGQMNQLGVQVELEKEVTPELVGKLKPDAVVIATGMTPSIPEIAGLDKERAVFAPEVLLGGPEVGKNVVIMGGGMVGCETAEFLVDKGKKVTILEASPRIAADMVVMRRLPMRANLQAKGVTMLAGVTCEEVTQTGVVITTKEGKKQTILADTIVIGNGRNPNKDLYKALEGKISEIYLVGDAVEPHGIFEAIHDGFRIGRTI
ncbi:FAD-dependent oxidoreductase, partial [Chloroflexota bacterium]